MIIREGKIVETGTLQELRHLTRSTLTLVAKGDVGELAKLNGVYDFQQKGQEVRFAIDNKSLNTILAAVAKLNVEKFEVVPPTLEDLFIRHYEG